VVQSLPLESAIKPHPKMKSEALSRRGTIKGIGTTESDTKHGGWKAVYQGIDDECRWLNAGLGKRQWGNPCSLLDTGYNKGNPRK